jgi:hypothetical protein
MTDSSFDRVTRLLAGSRSRRRALAALGALAVVGVVPVRAQVIDPTCTLGFIGGLLQFDPDCPPLDPPGPGPDVAPPTHLTHLVLALESGGTDTATSQQRAGKRGRRGKRKKAGTQNTGKGKGQSKDPKPTPTPTP